MGGFFDDSALGVWGGGGYVGVVLGLGVGNAEHGGFAVEDNGVVWTNQIQICGGGYALFLETGFVPALSDNPAVFGCVGNFLFEEVLKFFYGFCVGEIKPEEASAVVGEVDVGVD